MRKQSKAADRLKSPHGAESRALRARDGESGTVRRPYRARPKPR
jgi:hypothetical protein